MSTTNGTRYHFPNKLNGAVSTICVKLGFHWKSAMIDFGS